MVNILILPVIFLCAPVFSRDNKPWLEDFDFKAIVSRGPALDSNNQSPCQIPGGVVGVCRELSDCTPLVNQLQSRQNDPQFVEYLRTLNRICNQPPPTVCCPTSSVQRPSRVQLPTPQDGCGVSNSSHSKIVGGTPSKIADWPWLVLLKGYKNDFFCGGFLITNRHVLTAAHCLLDEVPFVRIGEHDLSTDFETQHIDVRVAKTVRHEDFAISDGKNDIGIIFLSRSITFTDKIKPICLPTDYASPDEYLGFTPFAAGWGRTGEGGKASNILREVQIQVYENSVCKNAYRSIGARTTEDQFDEAVICAGDLYGGKGTCAGDSGGPLMGTQLHNSKVIFKAIGIVAYSIGCARPNTPEIFTNVAYFLEWIKEKLDADA